MQNNMWTLTFLNNVNASLLFLPAVVLVERRTLWQHADKVGLSLPAALPSLPLSYRC